MIGNVFDLPNAIGDVGFWPWSAWLQFANWFNRF
jgi:hypothetical protein